MKRILTAMCALALLMAGCTPALAAEAPSSKPEPSAEPERSCYYPIKVEEYTSGPLDELRIDKVYQLSLSDDPSGIPTGDFERNGRLYYLLDMVRKDEVGVDTQGRHVVVVVSKTDDAMFITDSGTTQKAYWGGKYFRWWLEEQPGLTLYTRYPN